MNYKNVTVISAILVAGAVIVSACASSENVSYYEDQDTLQETIQDVLFEMGMDVEEYREKERDDGGFVMVGINRHFRQTTHQSSSDPEVLRLHIEAEIQEDGAYQIKVDAPSDRNYASDSGVNLRQDFYSKLEDFDLDTGETKTAENQEESDPE